MACSLSLLKLSTAFGRISYFFFFVVTRPPRGGQWACNTSAETCTTYLNVSDVVTLNNSSGVPSCLVQANNLVAAFATSLVGAVFLGVADVVVMDFDFQIDEGLLEEP